MALEISTTRDANAHSELCLQKERCDVFSLPSVVWRDQIVKHLDAADVLHLSQTSIGGREKMWALFPRVMKNPKFYAYRMSVTISATVRRISMDTTRCWYHPHTIATPSWSSEALTLRRASCDTSTRYTRAQTNNLFADLRSILAQCAFKEVTMNIRNSNLHENKRNLAKMKQVLTTLRLSGITSLPILLISRDYFHEGFTAYFDTPITLAEEILTIPMSLVAQHASGGGSSTDVHLPLLSHLQTKIRELGDRSLYRTIRVDAALLNSHGRYGDLTLSIAAAKQNATELVLSFH